ncbi:MAG: ankyrin repeat domain-containing protein [Desulfomonile tiedjei]|uniref:Ankyrin repeat domain-containing protein n=1 Tax=Desulfomonile tiedjei TaxID=2358 RepID=A0A9D6V011_9BACT|nr:ankyrin repeat domain-containing protein [Desulfomonile tiedjei]
MNTQPVLRTHSRMAHGVELRPNQYSGTVTHDSVKDPSATMVSLDVNLREALARLMLSILVLPFLIGAKGATEAQLNQDLLLEAFHGRPDRIEQLLRQGADVNAKNPDDRATALTTAVQRDHVGAVRVFLAHGARVNDKDILGYTPLMYATNAQIARMLVEKGADVNTRGKDHMTPLISVSSKGALEVAKILVSKGADVNAKLGNGKTALMESIERDFPEIAKLLIAHGADINDVDNQGRTALIYAASNKQLEVLRILLGKGADVNAKSKIGYPALMHSAGEVVVVEMLLDHGADANAKSEDGMTVLMRAAAKGHHSVVKLLLERGADINAQDKWGRTALYWAEKFGHVAIADLLKSNGAQN